MATAANPLSKIELNFECHHLPNLDTTSKSDPCIWLEYQNPVTKKWEYVDKTETVRDNLNPKFVKAIKFDYYFEEVQKMRARVVDVDDPKKGFESQDHIGDVEFTLGEVCGSRGRTLVKEIPNKYNKRAKLIVRLHELPDINLVTIFEIHATHLDKKDLFGKSDPYLEIARPTADGSGFVLIHRTEVIKKTLDPKWKKFEIDVSKLNGGDIHLPLRFEVYDWDSDDLTKSDFIGSFIASMEEINRVNVWEVINPKKKSKKGYKNSGTLHFKSVEVYRPPSFLDYLHGGCQINLMVAIDYTGSNGDPRNPKSLHHISATQRNQYQRVFDSVGQILMPYDYDGMIPVYGFGARLPDGQVSHCFHVNGNPNNPEVAGLGGLDHAYRASMNAGIALSGPTYFAPVIRNAAQIASSLAEGQSDVSAYLILLIITDGVINDMDATISAIVDASYLPMSIIIVGVGNADFSNMHFLDADGSVLKSGKKVAACDNVQFVPFRDFINQDPSRLAAAVLAEVPGQFLHYMKRNNIQPRPPPTQAQILQWTQSVAQPPQ